MTEPRAPAGICLAAGASTRMGSPKPLLGFGGRTALELVTDALIHGGCDPVVLVLGAAADEILAGSDVPLGVRVCVNERWPEGRSGSLLAGIRATPDAPAWVVLPVDHPLATSADVAALIGAWREGRPPVARVVREGRGGHPVLLDAALGADGIGLIDQAEIVIAVEHN